MTDNVRTLHAVDTEPEVNEWAVKTLEDLLARAKEGTLRAIFAVSVDEKDDFLIHRSGEYDRAKTVGALEWLKWETLKGMSEDSEIIP